ncbi:MAG: LamG domain-containing protein, partial [Candidatus Paceibacterota bacterium]
MNFYKFLLISILFLSAPLAHASVVSGAPSSSLRNGLVGYWTMDGKDLLTNVADKSGKGNTGYIQFGTSGNKATSTAKVVGKIGQAMKFDGVNDYVKVNDATGLSIGEQTDYSFFAWMKNLPPSAGEEEFVGKYASANYEYKFGMDLSNTYLVFQAWNLAGTNLVNTSSSALGAGIRTGWHYVGFVKNGGNVQFYYDGVQKGSTNFTDSTGNGTAPIVLGARDVTPTSPFSGIMDDTRIYNRALSATEIKKLYTMGATKFATSPSTGSGQLAQGLVGWWTMDGKDLLTNVADKSGSGNTGYMQGFTSTSSAKVAGKVGQAVKFNGTSNYVLAPTAPTLVVPYSMALWFYPTKFGVNNNLFFPNTGHEIFFGTGNIIEIDSYSAGTFRAFCNKTFTATDLNKWQYITIIINSTTDASQWKCYLNGASIGVMNPNSTGTYSAPGNTNWRIGASNLSNHFFNGSLDDIRIYS